MVYVYTREMTNKECIKLNDAYFNLNTINKSLTEVDKKIIKEIDSADVIDDVSIATAKISCYNTITQALLKGSFNKSLIIKIKNKGAIILIFFDNPEYFTEQEVLHMYQQNRYLL